MDAPEAEAFVAALHRARSPEELSKVQPRLGPGDEAIGLRMRDLFAAAKAAARMPLAEVEQLFSSPLYEVRMGAVCILDFRAKSRGVDEAERRRLHDLYLDHHDRITTWDMVDRAAPSVVGGYLLGRAPGPLRELAASEDPLRRRTAATAPLWFVRRGEDRDLAELYVVAGMLAADPAPVVHNAVGIALKHAGGRDPQGVVGVLRSHGATMPRAVLRAAASKLEPREQARVLG